MQSALSFTDRQLAIITEAARKVEPFDRQKFLVIVAQHLAGSPSTGAVERACAVALTTIRREARESAFRQRMDGGT